MYAPKATKATATTTASIGHVVAIHTVAAVQPDAIHAPTAGNAPIRLLPTPAIPLAIPDQRDFPEATAFIATVFPIEIIHDPIFGNYLSNTFPDIENM
jgi:hypothetical protein